MSGGQNDSPTRDSGTAPEEDDGRLSEEADARRACCACGGVATVERTYNEDDNLVLCYRCDDCGAGGDRVVNPEGETVRSGGPVLDPDSYLSGPACVRRVYVQESGGHDSELSAVGAVMPSGRVVIEWVAEWWPPGDRLDGHHQSVYDSLDDLRHVITDGEVQVFDGGER